VSFDSLFWLAIGRHFSQHAPLTQQFNPRIAKAVPIVAAWFNFSIFAGDKSWVAGVELATASEPPARKPRIWGRRPWASTPATPRCNLLLNHSHRPATFTLPEQEEHRHRSDSTADTTTIGKVLPSLAPNIFPEFHAPTWVETWIDPEEVETFGTRYLDNGQVLTVGESACQAKKLLEEFFSEYKNDANCTHLFVIN